MTTSVWFEITYYQFTEKQINDISDSPSGRTPGFSLFKRWVIRKALQEKRKRANLYLKFLSNDQLYEFSFMSVFPNLLNVKLNYFLRRTVNACERRSRPCTASSKPSSDSQLRKKLDCRLNSNNKSTCDNTNEILPQTIIIAHTFVTFVSPFAF